MVGWVVMGGHWGGHGWVVKVCGWCGYVLGCLLGPRGGHWDSSDDGGALYNRVTTHIKTLIKSLSETDKKLFGGARGGP